MKNILITGAGGSIGSELAIQIASDVNTKRVYLNDIAESSLFSAMQKVNALNHNCKIIPVVGDISSDHLIEYFTEEDTIDYVFNAAAYKHVNLSTSNQISYMRNNLESTKAVIKIAQAHGSNLVHISTDKAVDPINIMGASKRACEILVLNETESILGTFKIVRFGNVLNSSGSVVPIFRDQIKNGGPITITNSKAERFFMTMEQAVRLVIKCQYVAKNENILVLDMGKPVFIDALARDMIAEAGLKIVTSETPGKNEIVINYIGLREGEKLSEQLTYGRLIATNIPGIFSALEDGGVYDQVLTKINKLVEKREVINPSDLRWY